MRQDADIIPTAKASPGLGYFSPKELAERWGVTAGTVRLWINAGTLEAHRVGPRLLRVRADKVAEFERTMMLRAS